MLASVVIEHISSIATALPLFFYCRQDDGGRNSFVAMARTFLQQTMLADDSVVAFLFEKALASGEVKLTTQKLARELLDICLQDKPCYIVLDGLDECLKPEQTHIANWLIKFVDQSTATNNLSRCLFLSQEDASTKPLLKTLPTLRIGSKHNKADIEAYCNARAAIIKDVFFLTPPETARIAAKVTTVANGESCTTMHLACRLMFTQVCFCLPNWRCRIYKTRPAETICWMK